MTLPYTQFAGLNIFYFVFMDHFFQLSPLNLVAIISQKLTLFKIIYVWKIVFSIQKALTEHFSRIDVCLARFILLYNSYLYLVWRRDLTH